MHSVSSLQKHCANYGNRLVLCRRSVRILPVQWPDQSAFHSVQLTYSSSLFSKLSSPVNNHSVQQPNQQSPTTASQPTITQYSSPVNNHSLQQPNQKSLTTAAQPTITQYNSPANNHSVQQPSQQSLSTSAQPTITQYKELNTTATNLAAPLNPTIYTATNQHYRQRRQDTNPDILCPLFTNTCLLTPWSHSTNNQSTFPHSHSLQGYRKYRLRKAHSLPRPFDPLGDI